MNTSGTWRAEAGIAGIVERRQHQPLQVDDVRAPLARQPDQGHQPLRVLDPLERPADGAAPEAALGAPVEQRREGEALGCQGLVPAQGAADQRHLGAGAGQRPAERLVVGQGEQRRVDHPDLQGRPPPRAIGGRAAQSAGAVQPAGCSQAQASIRLCGGSGSGRARSSTSSLVAASAWKVRLPVMGHASPAAPSRCSRSIRASDAGFAHHRPAGAPVAARTRAARPAAARSGASG